MKEKTIKLVLKALIYGLLINISLQMFAEPITSSVDIEQSNAYYHPCGSAEINPK